MRVNLPAALAAALTEKGYNRTMIRLTEDGILLVPFHAGPERNRATRETIEIPDWGSPA
jgi:hypothetical protein